MRYMTDVLAKIGGEADALVGLVGGSGVWTGDSGREHRDDLAKILVNFLLQSQPDHVIVAPRIADTPVLDIFQLFGCPRWLYDTPEAKKTVTDFFYEWGQYSVEFDYEAFCDKVQKNTKKKHLFITRKRYPTFPKTTLPYKAGFIYLGQINTGALVERWRIVFRDVPNSYRHFLWLIPMNMITAGFENEELVQIREISDPLKRAQKALDLLGEIRWGWTGGAP